jgi:hypothetical protein
MANSKFEAGLVRSSASIAHAFLRDQVLTILAPVYLLHVRRKYAASGREIAGETPCGPQGAIELQPTGAGRS